VDHAKPEEPRGGALRIAWSSCAGVDDVAIESGIKVTCDFCARLQPDET
jgi:hypothetical protein